MPFWKGQFLEFTPRHIARVIFRFPQARNNLPAQFFDFFFRKDWFPQHLFGDSQQILKIFGECFAPKRGGFRARADAKTHADGVIQFI